ncbi:MAG: hypothetical protein NUV69_04810 [Candidatus Curtissbacteria bacterium]|nr:hypothetical protein [Candidatus Curtissbacteria bacterium]
MATQVHEVHKFDHGHDNGSAGVILAIIGLLLIVFMFFYFELPALRSAGPSVQVPGQVDVNVQGQ